MRAAHCEFFIVALVSGGIRISLCSAMLALQCDKRDASFWGPWVLRLPPG